MVFEGVEAVLYPLLESSGFLGWFAEASSAHDPMASIVDVESIPEGFGHQAKLGRAQLQIRDA